MTAQGLPALAGIAVLAIDCADPQALGTWWQGLVGGTLTIEEGLARLRTAGLAIDFCPVPDAKTVKNRLHLDLRSTDYTAAIAQAEAAGAVRADDVYSGDGWQVLRDPEGNEFCILRPESTA